ncbi:hypothetical protein AWC15_06305 [Mycobacterium lacus]|nr:hypothetical protein AWC15_06305 [Mycobacterium lacus]
MSGIQTSSDSPCAKCGLKLDIGIALESAQPRRLARCGDRPHDPRVFGDGDIVPPLAQRAYQCFDMSRVRLLRLG